MSDAFMYVECPTCPTLRDGRRPTMISSTAFCCRYCAPKLARQKPKRKVRRKKDLK